MWPGEGWSSSFWHWAMILVVKPVPLGGCSYLPKSGTASFEDGHTWGRGYRLAFLVGAFSAFLSGAFRHRPKASNKANNSFLGNLQQKAFFGHQAHFRQSTNLLWTHIRSAKLPEKQGTEGPR